MPPIAGVDDVYARLLSGFVLAGVPDATRGGVLPGPSGQVNAENLLQQARAAEGILLELPGLSDVEAPEYAYTVRLVRVANLPGGYGVEARCAETMFHHVWPTAGPEGLAPTLTHAVATHHAAFLDWRRKGGQLSYAERLGVPALPVEPPDPALIRFLAGLYRDGHGLAEGPQKGWWAPSTVWAGGITAGEGKDRVWHLGPSGEALSPEEEQHAARLRTAGWVGGITAGVFAIYGVVEVGHQAWNWYVHDSFPAFSFAQALGSGVTAALWVAAAQALVRQRERLFFKDPKWTRALVVVAAVVGMLPCAGWCCVGGLPLGVWVLYLLFDPRGKRIW